MGDFVLKMPNYYIKRPNYYILVEKKTKNLYNFFVSIFRRSIRDMDIKKEKEIKMKRNIFVVLLLAVVFSFCWKGEAEAYPEERTYTSNDFEYTYDKETGYIWILGYLGREKEITVPADFYGVPVKYISGLSDPSEYSLINGRITKINLPEGIEYLSGMRGFVCLREINIPESVKEIGYEAFDGCRKLENVELPKGLKEIGLSAFAECRSITSIELPDGLKEIADDAFYGCDSLQEIEIPNSVTKMGWEVFADCENLKKVKLSNNIKYIPDRCFEGCENLKSVKIPKQVKTIGLYAFRGAGLTQITIPSNVTEIDWYVFAGCDNLKKITIKSKKIKAIGKRAFSGIHPKAVFDVPDKCITKYKEMLVKSKSFKKGKVKVK